MNTVIQIIRNLEIYNITGIGNKKTVTLYKWINAMFSDLTVTMQENGNLLYSKNDIKLIIIEVNDKKIWFNYDMIWSYIKDHYKLNHKSIQKLTSYIMFRHYNLGSDYATNFNLPTRATKMFNQSKLV
jgi:hypothetical protein